MCCVTLDEQPVNCLLGSSLTSIKTYMCTEEMFNMFKDRGEKILFRVEIFNVFKSECAESPSASTRCFCRNQLSALLLISFGPKKCLYLWLCLFLLVYLFMLVFVFSYLASQDALEVMNVSESVSE